MTIIENALIRATINPKGAELTSLFHKQLQLEYLWSGDPAFWGKHSPVLFPIVGALKENIYYYKDSVYELARHGFARDKVFTVEIKETDRVVFLLTSSPGTEIIYPFSFEFRIHYSLHKDQLCVAYSITNIGKEEMYFSVGGHPAFALPLWPGTNYNDYRLEFEKEENTGRWPISKEGLIEKEPIPLLENSKQLPLTKELFHKDAIVLKNLTSSYVTLKSANTSHGWRFDFSDFPYLGIWAAKNADFVCIEPWCGIADSVESDQQFINKEGINHLVPGAIFSRTWSVQLW